MVSPDLALQAIQELEQASYRGDQLVDANLAVIEQQPLTEVREDVRPPYIDHQFTAPAPPAPPRDPLMPPLQQCSSMERILRSQVGGSLLGWTWAIAMDCTYTDYNEASLFSADKFRHGR